MMGRVINFPLGVIFYEREDKTISLIYAKSSNRIVHQSGLNDSWLRKDIRQASRRLTNAGWIGEEGKVID
jgi:hypothetical protein